MSFYKITAKSADEADISIYGEIGESMWGAESVSASNFKKELDEMGDVSKLNITVNSPGGSVFDGLAIYNMLKRHKATKNVTIDGIAASAASFIAMAGDSITIPKNAYIMIHRASTMAWGTSEDLQKASDLLDNVDSTLVDIYQAKTKLGKKKIKQMLEAETWMNGSEAVEMGFADVLEEEIKMVACYDLSKYKNAPSIEVENVIEPEEDKIDALLALYKEKIQKNNRR